MARLCGILTIDSILKDKNGNPRKKLFEENVRDFLGIDGDVNSEIAGTLDTDGKKARFGLMNNGVTIVASSVRPAGQEIFIRDFQIVNGCQTCNVLQQHLDVPNIDDLMLSVKIISSKSKTIKDKIIVGNNSQTEVKREQLVSLLDSQKYIEDY